MNNSVLYGIGGLVIGLILSGLFFSQQGIKGMNSDNDTDTTSMKHNMSMEQGMTMDDMVNDLDGKTGDDFDKAFIVGMIEHHQGAIDMAILAKQNAKHDELKKMADDIISAQTSEIEMMQEWQKEWGY